MRRSKGGNSNSVARRLSVKVSASVDVKSETLLGFNFMTARSVCARGFGGADVDGLNKLLCCIISRDSQGDLLVRERLLSLVSVSVAC